MPKDKKPVERLQHLNDILNTESSATAVCRVDDLLERLGISLRQLRKDMDKLRNMGADLQYDARLRGWRYTEKFHYSNQVPFTNEEMVLLRVGIELFAKTNLIHNFKKLPQAFWKLHGAVRKWVEQEASKKTVFFDPLPHYEGVAYLGFFLKAIEEQRRVIFSYQPFHSNQSKNVLFDPYFLRHYDRRWYVGGFSHDEQEGFVRTFPLERIMGRPEYSGFFHDKPPQYNAETYWKNIYGITVPPGGQVEEVLLEFSPIQGKYFLSTPFFEPFEILENTRERLVVRLHLIINIDLVRKLGSFGADVRVLAPATLIQKVRFFFQSASERYNL